MDCVCFMFVDDIGVIGFVVFCFDVCKVVVVDVFNVGVHVCELEGSIRVRVFVRYFCVM